MTKTSPLSVLRALRRTAAPAFALIALPLPHATAQAPARTALTLVTDDRELAATVLDWFAKRAPLPALANREHLVIRISVDGAVDVRCAPGTSALLKATARPSAILPLLAPGVRTKARRVRDLLALGMTQLGFPPREASKLLDAAATFPAQLETVELSVARATHQRGAPSVTCTATPTPESWFAQLVRALEPNPGGAPVLPATRMAPMVRVRAAVQPAALASALEPWAEALAWLGARNRQERARNLRLWSDLLRTQDGTLVWEGDPVDGPTRCLTGTRDPKTSAGLLVDPDYARMVRSTAMFGPMTEARIDARSSEHRGVGIWKMTVSSIFDSSATQDDRATYRAVAGWLDLHTRAASLAETRALIDAALDGGIRRAPLESRTVLRAEVRAWALLAKIGPLGNAFASRSTAAPESLTLTVDTVGGALRVQTGT